MIIIYFSNFNTKSNMEIFNFAINNQRIKTWDSASRVNPLEPTDEL